MRFRTLVAALATIPLALVSATPASAARADAILMSGHLIFAPQMDTTRMTRAVTGNGTLTAIGTTGTAQTFPCSYSGSVSGDVASGSGQAAADCGSYGFFQCNAVYVNGQWYWICVSVFVVLALDCAYRYDTLPPPSAGATITCLGQSVTVP